MTTKIERKTRETDIVLKLDLENNTSRIDIECGFLKHMLKLFCYHAGLSLDLKASGDTEVDFHHLCEDIGICIGKALRKACYDKPNARYGWCAMTMDGTLAIVSIDIGGRSHLTWKADFPSSRCGDFDMELIPEFWTALCREGCICMHVHSLAVDNSHHLAEAVFKGAGRAFRQALAPEEDEQSTKGFLL